jgi:hypothetical protein
MTGVNILMQTLKNKPIAMLMALACLLLSVSWCQRDALAATTTVTVEVNIVSTINLVAQHGIIFGDISVSSSRGTVTVATDGSRTTSGGVTVNRNTSGTPALYKVSGDPSAYFSITLPDSVVLTSDAGDSMTVKNFSSVPEKNGQLDSSGRENVNIGATLGVGAFQPFGKYKGIMSTTIEYN